MQKQLEDMIKAVEVELQNARREGILLEATLKDSEARFSALQGKLAGLQEAMALIEPEPEKPDKPIDKTGKGKKK